ncbi:MMPL family transporter [Microbulbifer sp. SA54]|uniref:MMPL family transporter n=1 Tax=Microbulbifer sp. SA54 TaxID=3401577 RepID=UPI003AAB2E24
MKFRIALWLGLCVVQGLAAWLNYSERWLQTDIVALAEEELASLPDSAAVKRANQDFQHSLVWVLVGPADSARTLPTATRKLAESLQQSAHVHSTVYRWGDDVERAQLWEFLLPRRSELLTRSDRDRLNRDPEAFVRDQLAFIYSPQSAGTRLDLERDPFFTFQHFMTAEMRSAGGRVIAMEDGIPVYGEGDRVFTLLRSQAAPLDMHGSIRQPLLALRTSLQQWAAAQGLTLLVAGAPLHSEYAAAGAQREIRLIGGFSVLAICLLSLLAFRSLRPLLLSLLAIGSGIAAGTAAVIALLGQVHILAFVFGTTVTGLAIDYAFHFICNRLREGAPRDRDIMSGLLLGLLSSCVAFFALALTPFPLLRQMGVFVGFGLLGAWLTVVLLFPLLLKLRPRRLDISTAYPRAPRWAYPLAVAAFVFTGALGILVAKPASDLSLFYEPPAFLHADEQQLNTLLPVRPASSYFLVRGASPDEVLQREYALGACLASARSLGDIKGFSAVSEWMPPAQVRRDNTILLRDLYGSDFAQNFYVQLGYSGAEVAAITANLQQTAEPVSQAEWLARLPATERQLWLGCSDGECLSLVRIFGAARDFDGAAMAGGLEGVSFRNPPQAIAAILAKQRDQLLMLLPLILVIATLVIALRTGWRAALVIAGLPLAAVSAAFAMAAFTSAGINLFHVAALLLVFGIGVDYAVFGYFSERGEASYTLLAIALAGITTLLGFGLLALSQTPAIADFGFTLAVGTVVTLLLAALYFSTSIFGGSR